MEEKKQDRVMRAKEAAALLGVNPRTISRLATAGGITKFYFPGRVRSIGYWASDIHALLERRGK